MAPAPSSPGNAAADPRTRVLGDFELIERIGQGSMGVVFKARQRSMDRIVAIKVLKPSLAHDEGYVTRFAREAQAAARLSHPNIVLAIDAGEKSGCRYFAMEYVEGHSVGLLLKAGPLEEQLALAITVQVARALDYAWSRERIVHRDIKPGNIIITPDGIAKLADLGLAHDADIGDEESFSKGGRILGTPFYISPEQIRRLPELDVRCDIYGLGATLYHMVTGQPPYKGGATKAVLARHLHEPPPDPRKVDRKISPAMARIIARCMATQREDRYPDAAALVADVEAILLPEGKRDAPTHRGRRVHRRPRASSPVPIFLTCLALVAFGIFALILASRSKSTPPPPPKVEAPQPQFPEAEKAYHAAAAFAEANPRKLVEAIARLQRVERDHGESPFAALAAQGRAALEGNLERRATAALVSLRVSADASITAGKYTQALAVFEKFPQEITNDAWRSRVEAERETVLRKAREAFGKALAAANATADIAARIQALGAIQASLPAAWQAERDKALAAAQAELAERVDQERQRDMHILQGLYAQLKRLYAQREYPRAQAAIQAALADAPEAVRPVLRRELAEAKAMPAVWGAAEKGAKSLIGKPYVLRGIPGTLVKVAAGQLTTKTLGGTFTADIHSLPRPQIVALIGAALPAREGGLAVARLLIAEGDAPAAGALLRKLEADGVDVAALQERLRRLAAAPDVEEAGAGVPGAEPPGAEPPAVEPPVKVRRKASLRVACDGTAQVILNGTPVPLAAAEAGAFAEADVEVANGDILAVAASGANASRALYVLLTTDDGRLAMATDPSWAWSARAAEGWNTKLAVAGNWEPAEPAYWPQAKAGYAEAGEGLPGCWIWGKGDTVHFRKIVRLAPTASRRARKEEDRALDKRYGPARDATLWIECQGGYRLRHNGRLMGCARTPVPKGAVYPLRVRQGDVIGVEAQSGEDVPWLAARLDVEKLDEQILADRTWVWSTDAPAGWAGRAAPRGRWSPSRPVGDGGAIWGGEAKRVLFRKTVDISPGAGGAGKRLQGRMRKLSRGRVSVAYDFSQPEQLADWETDGDWVWAKGTAAGARGVLVTQSYDSGSITVQATVEAAGGVVLGLWGATADRLVGYTVTLGSTRQGSVILRRDSRVIESARLPGGKLKRQIVLRKKGKRFEVDIDGKQVIDEDETGASLAASSLWRVGVRAGGPTSLSEFRITGQRLNNSPAE